jgi:hypothetical protein
MTSPRTRVLLAFLPAVLLATLWGTLVQTQFNLAALQALGAEVPWALRLRTTGQDVLGFGPLYLAVVAVSFGFAFPVAASIARYWPRWRGVLFALAGLTGLIVAIRLIDAVTPPPVLIAATRSTLGLLAMGVGGALGGVLFARLTLRRRTIFSGAN